MTNTFEIKTNNARFIRVDAINEEEAEMIANFQMLHAERAVEIKNLGQALEGRFVQIDNMIYARY